MSNCKNCVFCKRDAISNYIKEADFYKCDMDGDVILDPNKEGENCAWFKSHVKKRRSLISMIKFWIKKIGVEQ